MKCKDCKFITKLRFRYSDKVNYYCSLIKNHHSNTGTLRTKYNQLACYKFEPEESSMNFMRVD